MQLGIESCLLPLLLRVTGSRHFTLGLSTADPVSLKFLVHAKPAAYHGVFTHTIKTHAQFLFYIFQRLGKWFAIAEASWVMNG